MARVHNVERDALKTAQARLPLHVRLVAADTGEAPAYVSTSEGTVTAPTYGETDASGRWVLDLYPNVAGAHAYVVAPENSYYRIETAGPAKTRVRHSISVPNPTAPTTLSDPVALPAEGLNVGSTVGYEAATPSSPRSLYIAGQIVWYTGATATSFTGVTGGTGNIPAGTPVEQAYWVGDIPVSPPVGLPALHIVDLIDAHVASAISVAAVPGLDATQVQAALAEHQADIDGVGAALVAEVERASAAEATKVDKATLNANTVLGALLDDTPVPLTGAQVAGLIPSGTYAASRVAYPATLKLEQGIEDVVVLVAGDSTSDTGSGSALGASYRWPSALTDLLAADWPSHTVVLCQWGGPSAAVPNAWLAPQVRQAGAGGLRTDAASGSAASNVITDASITSGDAGKRVIGLNVPPRSYVGTVTAGVSFTLVNESGAPVYPLGAVASVQLSAAPLLWVANASMAATRWLSGLDAYRTIRYALVRPDLILANHGHNEIHTSTGFAPINSRDMFRSNYLVGVESLSQLCPGAGVVLMTQNPRSDIYPDDPPTKAPIIGAIAAERGYGLVDIFRLYEANPAWAADWLLADGVHPNAAGSAAWAAAVHALFNLPTDRQVEVVRQPPSLFAVPPQEQLAPGLVELLATGVLPSDWSLNAGTVTVEAVDGRPAARVVGTGVNTGIAVTLDATQVAGRWLTVSAETRCDDPAAGVNGGGFAIRYTTAAGVRMATTGFTQGHGTGVWNWNTISEFIPREATAVVLWLFGDQAGGASPTWFRTLVANRGRVPAGGVPLPTKAQLVPGAVRDEHLAGNVYPAKVSGLGPYFAVAGAIFPGTAGNYFSTPSAPANQITGPLELRVKLAAGTNTRLKNETLIAKWAGPKAWQFWLSNGGGLALTWSENGSAAITASPGGGPTLPATLAVDTWVRVQFTPNNGGGSREVAFATSTDDGATWTPFGTTATGAVTSLFNSTTQSVEVGSFANGAGTNFIGTIMAATIHSTLGGPAVQSWTWTDHAARTYVAPTGETWTLHGYVSFAARLVQSFVTAADAAALAAAGSGSVVIRKPEDEAVPSSAVLQDDDHLRFAAGANEVWEVEFTLLVDGATTGDIRASVAGPSGASGSVTAIQFPTSASSTANALIQQTTTVGGLVQSGLVGAGTTVSLVIKALVVTGATAGDVKLQWAQNVSDPTATRVLANSRLVARRS